MSVSLFKIIKLKLQFKIVKFGGWFTLLRLRLCRCPSVVLCTYVGWWSWAMVISFLCPRQEWKPRYQAEYCCQCCSVESGPPRSRSRSNERNSVELMSYIKHQLSTKHVKWKESYLCHQPWSCTRSSCSLKVNSFIGLLTSFIGNKLTKR